ncbi:hypothetical protein RchiOBHm_Chr4g0406981 [Rosa chinensis]|uniref:Uncharacterized protein n=1 Tax=Rosa chinensis TaxID=74649 RepID=A0A2P6QUF6_ROSCH|nr:hypothetical protein RchiOBHm_Chr4g0406981 [Rosa chinensis]
MEEAPIEWFCVVGEGADEDRNRGGVFRVGDEASTVIARLIICGGEGRDGGAGV